MFIQKKTTDHLLHITSMRAYIGVFPVIIFHIFPEWLPGGFLGVDVFFVISGFLITKILFEQKSLSIFEFYEKRARRIIPLVLLVLTISSIIAFILFLPSDLRIFSRNLSASSLFLSNWMYFFTTGYMAPSLDLDPIVHTWSLGIEFFFYFTFPLIILILRNYKIKIILTLILIILIISFLINHHYSTLNDPAIFFGYHGRYWEFMIGSFSYFLRKNFRYINQKKKWINDLFVIISIFIILYIFLFADRFGDLSIYTFIVCFFSMMIIILGDNVNFIHRLISSNIFIFLGTISFGMYLWHKPIIAFSLYYFDKVKLSLFDMILVFILTIVLSAISYKFFESPIRNKKSLSTKKFSIFVIIGITSLFLLGVLGFKSNGFPKRFDQRVVHLDNQWKAVSKLPNLGCSADNIDLVFSQCSRGMMFSDNLPKFILLGDSHATSLIEAFDEIAKDKFTYINLSSPACGLGFVLKKNKELSKCGKHLKLIENMSTQGFFKDIPLLVYTLKHRDSLLKNVYEINNEQFKSHLDFLDMLSKKTSNLLLLEPTPAWNFNIPKKLAKRTRFLDQGEFYIITQDEEKFTQIMTPIMKKYKKLSNNSSLELFYTSNIFCGEFINNKCSANTKDQSFYMDDNHLSIDGARLIIKELKVSGFFGDIE